MPEYGKARGRSTSLAHFRGARKIVRGIGGERLGKFCSSAKWGQEVQASQDAVTLPAGIGGLLKSQPAMLPKTMLNPKVSRKCA